MPSNLTVFHAVDLTIIVGGIASWLWKYGQVRIGATDRRVKSALFLLNLTLMIHFWIQAGAQAFLPGRTLEFYLSLVAAAATTTSVVYAHLRLVQSLPEEGHASASSSRSE
jgi:hypothetical protein